MFGRPLFFPYCVCILECGSKSITFGNNFPISMQLWNAILWESSYVVLSIIQAQIIIKCFAKILVNILSYFLKMQDFSHLSIFIRFLGFALYKSWQIIGYISWIMSENHQEQVVCAVWGQVPRLKYNYTDHIPITYLI